MLAKAPSLRIWPVLGLMTGLALFAFGCGEDSTTPIEDDPISQTEDINDPYGGFNTGNELVGFGDEFLLGEESEFAVQDEIASDPEVVDMMEGQTATLYGVRVLWGQMDFDVTAIGDEMDWTGSAVVDEGAVIAARTIRFEPRDGDRLVPRDEREMLEWISTTTIDFDGLQLLVVDPTNGDSPNSFTVSFPNLAEPFEVTFEVTDLDSLDMVYDIGTEGHQVQIHARQVELHTHCNRGWVSGLWQNISRTDDDDAAGILGRFRGHWVDTQGVPGGHLRGYYGINARGHRVMYGKLIDSNGNFRGLLRGTWSPAPSSTSAGTFRSHWLDLNRHVVGGMRGVWERRDDQGAGFFHGAWATRGCGGLGDQEIDESIF